LLLTFNSKEAVNWIREIENELVFMAEFLKDSQIRDRTYNLVVPRVPITFEPSNKAHLHEIEEANGLHKHTVRKAKWIKPPGRRRLDQIHAYTILTLPSIESTNVLIRDGLIICGTKVRPTKQKMKPLQC
ncbi:hypothetical protein BC827DRAFT_1087022, partial [Russula dissimulans]